MQKMWSQMMGRLPPEAAPQCKRGLNMALCSFGFLQSTSGLSPRPNFPLQQRTLDYLHDKIKEKQSYAIPFSPDWTSVRSSELRMINWKRTCDQLKVTRRRGKGGWPAKQACARSFVPPFQSRVETRCGSELMLRTRAGHGLPLLGKRPYFRIVNYYNLPR